MTDSRQRLEENLKQLHLAAMLDHYQEQAQAAVQNRWPYETYLTTLVEEEMERRTHNRLQRRIQEARFPLHKEVVDFDFDQIPHLNQQKLLALAQGDYLQVAESILMVVNP
ncbi:MAG: ATP-binding protein, partial [Dehalococcoidia bacterium]|nr:ATP-binding protein [Dehalococcoidia bacterium]